MDEAGGCCRAGETGEIVIRGANVTAGYENNPKANAEAFADGWFRTGDQGVLDADGYLTITGRLKEIINRGGEKIQPARGRRDPDGPPGGRAGRDLRHAASTSSARKSRRPSCCAKAQPRPSASCSDFVARAARRLQGAAQDPVHGRDPEGRDRQAAAHRPGREARPGLSAAMKIASSAPARSAAARREARRWPARKSPSSPADATSRRSAPTASS